MTDPTGQQPAAPAADPNLPHYAQAQPETDSPVVTATAPSGAAPAAPVGGAPAPYGAAPATSGPESQKSFVATWLFAWLLGAWGVDRFYLGKVGTGVAKLLTFGGLGVWTLVDLILVLVGAQRDKQGRTLAGYTQHKKLALIVTGSVVALSMLFGIVNVAATIAAVGARTPSISAPDAGAFSDEGQAAGEPAASAQDWAEEEFGTFAPQTFSGSGDDLVALPAGVTVGIVTSTHDGQGNFALTVLDADNQPTGDMLANAIGVYAGTGSFGVSAIEEGTTLQVMADGNWTITVAPLASAPSFTEAGTGDVVMLYDGPAASLAATHDGEWGFLVYEETAEAFGMKLVVSSAGPYSGTVPLSAGPSVITVSADGNWTLVVK